MKLYVRFVLLITLFFFSSVAVLQARHKTKKGIAGYYASKFNGRKTTSGDIFKNTGFTAACNRLALGTFVKVTNMANGRTVYVRINDHLAATNGRLIDVTYAAAKVLGFIQDGTARVKVKAVSKKAGRGGIRAQTKT